MYLVSAAAGAGRRVGRFVLDWCPIDVAVRRKTAFVPPPPGAAVAVGLWEPSHSFEPSALVEQHSQRKGPSAAARREASNG